jgi:hypothetical protein
MSTWSITTNNSRVIEGQRRRLPSGSWRLNGGASSISIMEEQPGPLAMFRKIPAKIRWWLYSIGLTVFAIEGVLDAADAGLVAERPQGIALGVLGVFGFTMATANTSK